MIATRNDYQRTGIDRVDQAVGLINASRPKSSQVFSQWLWFANPFKGRPHGIEDQLVYPLKRLFVLTLPIYVIVPGI